MARVFYPQARAILQVVFDAYGTDDDDTEAFVIPVLPKDLRITRNSYRQADSWELTFDANDLPIDPQLVRGGAAEIFLFQVPGITDDQRVVNRANAFDNSANRKRRDAVDDLLLDARQEAAVSKFTFDNKPAIVGLFDNHSLSFSSSGKWVTISGQDYTDFLLKKQWRPTPSGRARRIPTGRRLDIIMRDILAEADTEGRLSIRVEGIDPASLPIVGAKETRCHRRGIPVQQDTSYWDVLYKLALRHGTICYVRGLDVVVTRPANVHEGYDRRIKRLTWGHNVSNLELTRRLGKEATPVIVIKATDPETRETILIDFPVGAFKKIRQRGGGTTKTGKPRKMSITKTEEYQIVPVFGITDRAVLRRAAELRYNLLARGERTVRISTRDLQDADGNNLLELETGDAVMFEFADFNREVISNPEVPAAAKVAHLVRRGYGEAVAQAIARHYDMLSFIERPLRVREIGYDYSSASGVDIEIEAVDFVVVDGVRDASTKESRRRKRGKKYQDEDGNQIGPSEQKKDAFVRQHGG